MLHLLLSYRLRMKAMAAGGRPMHSKDPITKLCATDGKAALKSKSSNAPLSLFKLTVMDA